MENYFKDQTLQKIILNTPRPELTHTPKLFSINRALVSTAKLQPRQSLSVNRVSLVQDQVPTQSMFAEYLQQEKQQESAERGIEDFHSDSEQVYFSTRDINKTCQLSFKNQKSFFKLKKNEMILPLSKYMNLESHNSIIEAQKLKRNYQCKKCHMSFDSGCALGGHISKVHSLVKKGYKRKIQKEKNSTRKQERTKFYNSLTKKRNKK